MPKSHVWIVETTIISAAKRINEALLACERSPIRPYRWAVIKNV